MYRALLEALEAGATVVTANNRLARTLQHAFERRKLVAGVPAWVSPDVVSWSAWLRRLWAESRLRGGQARQFSLLDEATARLLWQQAISAVEQHRPALPLGHYVRVAQHTWKLVHDWDALTAEEWTGAGLTPDQQAFLRWSGEFRSRCAAAGMVDAEQLAALLSKDIRAGLFADLPPVWFAGFDEWSPARLGLRVAFDTQPVAVHVQPVAPAAGQPQGYRCASPDDELLAAARWARHSLEQKPAAVIGVVVPDLASRAALARRIFLDVFAPDWRVAGVPEQLPLNISYGRPLADTPIVQVALRLFRLLEGRAAFDDFSLLLRSPWLRGASAEAAGRARLEIELRDTVRIEFALRDAQAITHRLAPLFGALLNACMERAQDRQRRSAVEWAHYLSDFLQVAGWPGRDNLDSETWQTLKAWNELLASFAAGNDVLGAVSRAEALGYLTQLAQQRLFQPEGVADGVQVMGVLEAAGHEFDRVWISGLARELWPANARPDPFVPLALQRRLNMPDSSAGRVLDYTRQLTARLLGSAAEVVISWPARLDGEELGPTLLIDGLEHSDRLSFAASPLWNEVAFAARQTELLDPDPAPAWRGQGRVRGGVKVLNLQALSPLNAFAEQRLGAAEIRRPPVGIDAMRRGILTHKALEDFYRMAPDRDAAAVLDKSARLKILTESLQTALQDLPGIQDAFMQKLAALELQQQLVRLEKFIDLDLQRPGFRVDAREKSVEVNVGPLTLSFKLDRLDILPDGSKLVVDYKTGNVNRQSWNPNRPGDLQLPVYVTSVVPDAAGIAFAQVSALGVAYAGAGDGTIDLPGVREPGTKRGQVRFQYPHSDRVIESWEELREVWAALLIELAEQFAGGDFRFDPRNPASARGQMAVLSRIYDAGIGLLEDDE